MGTTKGRGGKREGAGRPVSPNPLLRVSLRLSAAHIARLREVGGGNVSEGVRRLLDAQDDRLREALRLACQDLRGPGVPVDDLVVDYLRAAGTASAQPAP